MGMQEIKKALIFDYFVIVTGSLFGTVAYCAVLEPDAVFTLDYFIWIFIFSAMGDLPLLLFYSKKELTEKEFRGRMLLHFIVLEIVLLVAAYQMDMYHTLPGGIYFAGIVAIVYGLVRFVGHQIDCKTALKMNERLFRIRDKEE
ncbi:MAG: hypothetical protein PWP24_355 [Clostridiales bacterium]|nr:hypothetical protein [Clostridiales bacterium]